MGHYDDCYEAEYERQRKERAVELARSKKRFPRDPSQWGLDLEERVKLLEQRLNKLEDKCR